MNNERSPHMNWTRVCLSLVFIVATCSYAELAEAKSEYEVIHTGIQGGGCWYDDTHFVIVRGRQPAPGQEFEVEGLYYLDPAKPKDLRKIDLAPIEPHIQQQIREVSCQDETVLFSVMAPNRKTSQLYGLKIGGKPELIANMRWARPSAISLKGQYVLGNKVTVDHGVWEEHSDCDVRFLKQGFKALCWPRDTIAQWLTPKFVVSEYLWRATTLINGVEGKRVRIPNTNPPLKLDDGTQLKQGYLLRDLGNEIVQQIPTQQGSYKMDRASFQPSPGGTYLYARCSKVGDYDPPKTFFGRICRFNLGNKETQWKEVFSVQREPNERASLYDLDVNDQGDVVVMRRAHRVRPTFWKYTAQRASVEQLPAGQLSQEIEAVRFAPDGRTISYLDKGQLVLLRSQEGKP